MKKRGVLEDPSVRLVRADMVEAWGRRLYVMQNLPFCTSSVRRAILGECDDGRAAYVEYWRVGWRLWQTTEWVGPIAELGLPGPVPRGFEITRGLRIYRVRERSMVLRVNGVDRIVSFTGEELPRAGHWGPSAGMQAVLAVPTVGTIVDWTTTAARRLKPGSTRPEAIAAAAHWRRVLERAAARQPPIPDPRVYYQGDKLATWWQRVRAALIDVLALAPGFTLWIMGANWRWPGGPLIGFLVTAAIWLYNRCYLQGRTGQSWGKRAMGLKLIRMSDKRSISPYRAFARDLVNGLTAPNTFGLGFLFPLWTARRQTLADMAVKTVVISL